MDNLFLNLSPKVSIVFWKNNNSNDNNVYIYNQTKKIKLFFNVKSIVKFDKNSNTIVVKNNNVLKDFFFLKEFLKFIRSLDVYYFSKIKFKGKGFRMRFLKKNKFVKFFFGRSHKTFVFFKKIIMRKINKYKLILKSIKKGKVMFVSKILTKIKPVNVYTLRGIRKSKQIIYKRKGKKGTYI